MLLKDKVAVVYGAGRRDRRCRRPRLRGEGARLFLTGRGLAAVEAVAEEIVADGGSAEAAEVDALDEQAVDEHLRVGRRQRRAASTSRSTRSASRTRRSWACRWSTSTPSGSRCRSATYATSYFLTARLAARRMVAEPVGRDHDRHRAPSRTGTPLIGGYGPAHGRQGGAHPGPVRRARAARHPRGRPAAAGLPETATMREVFELQSGGVGHDLGAVPGVPRRARTHPRRLMTLDEVAERRRSSWPPTGRAG